MFGVIVNFLITLGPKCRGPNPIQNCIATSSIILNGSIFTARCIMHRADFVMKIDMSKYVVVCLSVTAYIAAKGCFLGI